MISEDDYNIIIDNLERSYSTDSPFRRAVEKLIAEKAKESKDGNNRD